MIQNKMEQLVPVFSDEVCAKIDGSSKEEIKIFVQRGMLSLPLRIMGRSRGFVFGYFNISVKFMIELLTACIIILIGIILFLLMKIHDLQRTANEIVDEFREKLVYRYEYGNYHFF